MHDDPTEMVGQMVEQLRRHEAVDDAQLTLAAANGAVTALLKAGVLTPPDAA